LSEETVTKPETQVAPAVVAPGTVTRTKTAPTPVVSGNKYVLRAAEIKRAKRKVHRHRINASNKPG
jgi:hypothetical protein